MPLPLENLEPLVECPHCGHPTPLPANFVTDLDVYFSEKDLAERAAFLAERATPPKKSQSRQRRLLNVIIDVFVILVVLLLLILALKR